MNTVIWKPQPANLGSQHTLPPLSSVILTLCSHIPPPSPLLGPSESCFSPATGPPVCRYTRRYGLSCSPVGRARAALETVARKGPAEAEMGKFMAEESRDRNVVRQCCLRQCGRRCTVRRVSPFHCFDGKVIDIRKRKNWAVQKKKRERSDGATILCKTT